MKEHGNKGYLAYWDGKRGAERNPAGYCRRDDGSHIYHNAPEYYEWWYFDASFENGYHMVAAFHYRNLFLRPMSPSLQLFIYRPDGTRLENYELVPPERASADPDYCCVTMGESRVRDMGDYYLLDLRIKDCGAGLTFRNEVPPWKPGQGFNYKDEDSGMTAGWVVPVPHGAVEGELFIEGERVPVSGKGYHDHNWGNYPCHRTFRGWYWGRIHHERYTVDYGWVLPREKDAPVASPLMIARPGEIVLSTDRVRAKLRDTRVDGESGHEFAGRLTLGTRELGVEMELDIRTDRILESARLPRVTERDQHYYRFLADYDMRLAVDGSEDRVKGEMLHEYIIL
jgi:predicted secreted hydrolase